MKKKVIVSTIALIGLVTIAFGCGSSSAKRQILSSGIFRQ